MPKLTDRLLLLSGGTDISIQQLKDLLDGAGDGGGDSGGSAFALDTSLSRGGDVVADVDFPPNSKGSGVSPNGINIVGSAPGPNGGNSFRGFQFTTGFGFKDFGTLPGGTEMTPTARSGNWTTGFAKNSDGNVRAFRYGLNEGVQFDDMGLPVGAVFTIGLDTNENGSVVGYSNDGDNDAAFFASAPHVFTPLPFLGDDIYSRAYATTDDESKIVGNSGAHPVLWTWVDDAYVPTDLGLADGFGTGHATGISETGVIVGTFETSGPASAFMCITADEFTLLSPPDSQFSEGIAIAPSGGFILIHGTNDNGDERGFIYDIEAMEYTDLGIVGAGAWLIPMAISDGDTIADLVVTGQADDLTENAVAFRWTEATGAVNLGTIPGGLTVITDDLGRIINPANTLVLKGGTVVDRGNGIVEFNSGAMDNGVPGVPSLGLTRMGAAKVAETQAVDVTPDGEIVVGFFDGPNAHRGFIWARSVGYYDMSTIATGSSLDPARTTQNFITGTGTIGGDSPVNRAFLFGINQAEDSNGPTVVPLAEDAVSGQGADVSADGLYVVGTSGFAGPPAQAFRWNSDTNVVELLGTLEEGGTSSAVAITADGTKVALFSTVEGLAHPATWTSDDGIVDLGMPEGYNLGQATDISDDGLMVVGWVQDAEDSSTTRAFKWTEADGFVVLPLPLGGATAAQAMRVTDNGLFILVYAYDGADLNRAYVYDVALSGYTLLPLLLGGTHLIPKGVSSDAGGFEGLVVVGEANDTTGVGVPFRWTSTGGTINLGSVAGGATIVTDDREGGVTVNPVATLKFPAASVIDRGNGVAEVQFRKVLETITSDATPAEMTAIPLQNDWLMGLRVVVTAIRPSNGTSSMWALNALVRRRDDAASTALVGLSDAVIIQDTEAGDDDWSFDIQANTDDGALKIIVTGAAYVINWRVEADLVITKYAAP